MTTATRTRKPKVKPLRKARLMDTGEGKLLRLQAGDNVPDYYRLTEMASDFGRAIRLQKMVSGRECYDVLLNGNQSTCECKGYLRWNHCKHLESLIALTNAGRL